ncbi:MAG: universal stress protein [Bacteroidia bacterium]
MANYKRIMVGIDFSEADQVLLEYTKMINEVLNPNVIYFVHAEEDLDLPPEVLEELGVDSLKPSDESLLEKLETLVAQHIKSDNDTDVICQVVEGGAFEGMLHWAHIKNVDLLIVGKKHKENGQGVLPQKLARKVDGSILFIPEDYQVKPVEKILLPLDFSKKSKLAIDTATGIYGENNVELIAANCYSLPLGWHKTGKEKEQIDSVMQAHAQRKFDEFLDGYGNDNLKIRSVFKVDDNREPSEEILQMAEENAADMIMIGSRGKTDIATVILGSTTEKLLQHDKMFPIWVIKKKGELLGFLDALFKLK